MLSPSHVILIPQSREENPRSSLRANSAKHLCSFSQVLEPKPTAEILRHENDCAEGTLECGGLTPPSPLGRYALATLRRRRAAALQGASRIFMHGGESKDHDVLAQDDRRLVFPHVQTPRAVAHARSLHVRARFPSRDCGIGMTMGR